MWCCLSCKEIIFNLDTKGPCLDCLYRECFGEKRTILQVDENVWEIWYE